MIISLSRLVAATHGEPVTDQAVMVVTTAMTTPGTATPFNQIVSDVELLEGELHTIELVPGQYLTITPFNYGLQTTPTA